MPTFKTVIHPPYKRADGTFRVKIRITHNKQSRYLPTPYYASAAEVNDKFDFKRGTSYVDDTRPIIDKYRKVCNKYADKIDTMDVGQIVELIQNFKDEENFKLDFFAYGQLHIERLKATGRIQNATMYGTALSALRRFIGRDNLDIREITSKFVGRFIDFLIQEPPRPGHKKGRRAPSLYFSTLQALHNAAKREYNDEDLGIIRIQLSPFSKVKKPPIPTTDKQPLSLAQFRKQLTIPDDTSFVRKGDCNLQDLGRDVGILTFLLIGINTVDLYEAKGIQNGRLIYNRKKTKNRRTDNARVNIRIEPEVMPLIEKYRDPTGVRLFNFHRLYKSVNNFNRSANIGLKRIGKIIGFKDLETYTFRRTWASFAWNYCGIRDDIIDFALGHSPRSASKLAHIYITEDWDVVDQANRLVIDCIFSNRVNTIIKNTIQTQQITLIAPNNPSSTLGQRLIASR